MVMNHGQLVFDGEPQEAVTRYFKIKQGEFHQEQTIEILKNDSLDFSKYKIPDTGQYSGNMNVLITKYYYEFNGSPDAEICERGDVLHIWMVVEARI